MKNIKRFLIKLVLWLIFLPLLGISVLAVLVRFEYFGEIPDPQDIEIKSFSSPTQVLDKNGKIIGEFTRNDGEFVPFNSLPKYLPELLVNTEDKRFYSHKGIDYYSLGRVLIKSVLLGDGSAGGGSTITQQLVKNLYHRKSYRYLYYPINKLREMVVAQRLEEHYSKEEIIELYLNSVPFGSNTNGIYSASDKIFGKLPIDLNINESATLVGVLKATTSYSPILNPERSIERRNLVLNLAIENKVVPPFNKDSLFGIPLNVATPEIQNELRPYLLTEVRKRSQQILDDFPENYDILGDGLQIITTVDLKSQEIAEKAFRKQLIRLQELFNNQVTNVLWDRNKNLLKGLKNTTAKDMEVFTYSGTQTKKLNSIDSLKHYLKFLHAGLLGAEPSNGAINHWVGGIDYRYFPYDHVNINAKRQVGSIIKPFLYAAAIEQGISPCTEYDAAKVTYTVEGNEWTPGNSGALEDGDYALQEALSNSINTIAVKIIEDVGVENFRSLLKSAGITSSIPKYPSIALGTPEISLFEMVQAYTIFANKGLRSDLYLIEEIRNSTGKSIYKRKSPEKIRVLEEKTAALMLELLKGVVNTGTATSIRTVYKIYGDIGGKTGTTQNASDGWFMGITPKLIVGAWVGGEYPGIRFERSTQGQGARTALPIVGSTLNALQSINYKNISQTNFWHDPTDYEADLNCDPFEKEGNFFRRFFSRFSNKKNLEKNEEIEEAADKKNNEPKEKRGFLKKIKGLFSKKDDKDK